MSPHDPICIKFRRSVDDPGMEPCICGELREAREDQSELIAQAIEVSGADDVLHPDFRALAETLTIRHAKIARGRNRRGA